MRREPHVRFREGGGVKFPSATRPCRQRHPVADRSAAGTACASMTKAVVGCDGRRCRLRLGGRTVTSSDTTRRPPVVSEGQQKTPAAHSSGRSCVQLVNLPNIAADAVARIVLVPLSGQASGEFQFKPRGRTERDSYNLDVDTSTYFHTPLWTLAGCQIASIDAQRALR